MQVCEIFHILTRLVAGCVKCDVATDPFYVRNGSQIPLKFSFLLFKLEQRETRTFHRNRLVGKTFAGHKMKSQQDRQQNSFNPAANTS